MACVDIQRPAWRARAACVGMTSTMFAEDEIGQARALAICAGCGVRRECLDEAREIEATGYNTMGVRGGLTPEQRGRPGRRS